MFALPGKCAVKIVPSLRILNRLPILHTSFAARRLKSGLHLSQKYLSCLSHACCNISNQTMLHYLRLYSSDTKEKVPLIVEMMTENEDLAAPLDDPVLKAFDDRLQQLDSLLNTSIDVPDLSEISEEAEINLSRLQDETGEGQHYEEEVALGTDKKKSITKGTNVMLYGSPDPTVPLSDTPCPGCGANLHCQDSGIPGYLPSQKYRAIPQNQLRDHYCQRCHLMRQYNLALNVSVQPEEFTKIISKIKGVHALVILVVDVTDVPNSFIKQLPKLIGRKRPIYVIGNKVDLLPKDEKGYLNRVKAMLENVIRDEGLYDDMYVHYVNIVSAKTGYGVEELINKLFKDWEKKGHVYLLGCTNVGKSTLFNALLSSDYCKAAARDFVHRATTSLWPGTTLNLLQFPIMTMVPWQLHKRVQRLIAEKKKMIQEEKLEKHIRNYESRRKKTSTLYGHIGQTFLGKKDEKIKDHNMDIQGFGGGTYSFDVKEDCVSETVSTKQTLWDEVVGDRDVYKDTYYKYSRWCYDTPGVVNPEQIINLLSQKELSVVLCNKPLKPRTFIINPTQVLFLSGLGRLDYIQGDKSIYLTVFSSSSLSIHVMNADTADEFYEQNIGTETFGIPLGGEERIKELAPLVGKDMEVQGIGWKCSAADVMLSSLGWVAVTAGKGMEVTLRAYTPDGCGCGLRTPSALRYSVNHRGSRIKRSAEFRQPKKA